MGRDARIKKARRMMSATKKKFGPSEAVVRVAACRILTAGSGCRTRTWLRVGY